MRPKEQQPMGRPPKISPQVIDQVTTSVRAGNYVDTAAAQVGITKETLYAWLRRGAEEKARIARNHRTTCRTGEKLYVSFSDSIAQAQADAEARAVAFVTVAAQRDWAAAAWYLERKHNKRWGRRDQMKVDATLVNTDSESVAKAAAQDKSVEDACEDILLRISSREGEKPTASTPTGDE